MMEENQRSNWWFLLPIFMQVIGGIIAYFVLRSSDQKKAKNCLYLGIALTAVGMITNYLILNEFVIAGTNW